MANARKLSTDDNTEATLKRMNDLKLDLTETIKRNFKQSMRKTSVPALSSTMKLRKLSTQEEKTEESVDPIYMALKMANEMAQRRRSVVKSPQMGVSGKTSTSHNNGTDILVEDASSETSQSRESIYNRRQSNCQISLTPTSVSSSSRSSPALPILAEVKSSPNLTSQKSTESNEGDIKMPLRQVRKLRMHMKSFSLDCDSSTEPSTSSSGPRSSFSVLKGGRCFKVRPLAKPYLMKPELSEDDSAIDSDAYASAGSSVGSNKSISLGPLLCVVTHDFRAKFKEELDLRKGERIVVINRTDPDWWQGYKQNEAVGRFPSTSVGLILPNERVMQVIQNLNLWDGSTSLRLYRDQVVFAQREENDCLVAIRTEKNRRINCPVNYLLPLE